MIESFTHRDMPCLIAEITKQKGDAPSKTYMVMLGIPNNIVHRTVVLPPPFQYKTSLYSLRRDLPNYTHHSKETIMLHIRKLVYCHRAFWITSHPLHRIRKDMKAHIDSILDNQPPKEKVAFVKAVFGKNNYKDILQ